MKLSVIDGSKEQWVEFSEDVTCNYIKEVLTKALGHEPDKFILNNTYRRYVSEMKHRWNCPCCTESPSSLTQEMVDEFNECAGEIYRLCSWDEITDKADIEKSITDAKHKIFSPPYLEVFTYVFGVMNLRELGSFPGYLKLCEGENIELQEMESCLRAFCSKFEHYPHVEEFCRLCEELRGTIYNIRLSFVNHGYNI